MTDYWLDQRAAAAEHAQEMTAVSIELAERHNLTYNNALELMRKAWTETSARNPRECAATVLRWLTDEALSTKGKP